MKYVIGLILASLSTLTYAQKTPLACLDDAAAGLKWEGGKWSVRSFIEEKFILVREGKTLTVDSVAKAINGSPSRTTCNTSTLGLISCHDNLGASLFFSPATNKGGISKIFGSTMASDGNFKDTVTVSAFTCTPF